MEGIPPYPATVWSLVEQAADRWADHVVLADDHGRSLTGRQLQRRHGDEPLFHDLRALMAGGAPTPPEVAREAREVLGVQGIVSSWGLTEFPVATFPSPDAPFAVLDHTTGPVVAGVEVRAVGTDERECAVGQEGELRLRGPQCFLGYVDASLEVEEALFRHPDIIEAAVVSAPDPRTGERVCAFVVPASGASITLQSLAQHCRALGLAIQKVPEQLEVVDSLPRNPFGKVLKQDLKARLA